MILGDLLEYIDFSAFVVIWENVSTTSDQWEITFEGSACDIPWYYFKRRLIKKDDNEGSEAICPFVEDDRVGLRITLAEEE